MSWTSHDMTRSDLGLLPQLSQRALRVFPHRRESEDLLQQGQHCGRRSRQALAGGGWRVAGSSHVQKIVYLYVYIYIYIIIHLDIKLFVYIHAFIHT